jgi:hypothetical protein
VSLRHSGSASILLGSGIIDLLDEPETVGWALSVASMRRAVRKIIQLILHDVYDESDSERQLEAGRADLLALWTEASTDSHSELFRRCAILSCIRGVGLQGLQTLVSSPVVTLLKAKAFVYPYLVSKKFRYIMFTLSQKVVDGLVGDKGSAQHVSMAAGIESWDSPRLLEIIHDAWTSWSVDALSVDLLHYLGAEAITAVSKEDNSVSTLVCGHQFPEVLSLELSLAHGDSQEESDASLSWNKVAVLELLLHEFCRVWRRMIQPADMALTPRGIGAVKRPNAGGFVDDLIWGPLLSTDLRYQQGGLIVNSAKNTANMLKALDIHSWDDLDIDFCWNFGPCNRRSTKFQRRGRRISAGQLVLF